MYLTLGYRFDGSTSAERVIKGTKEDVEICAAYISCALEDGVCICSPYHEQQKHAVFVNQYFIYIYIYKQKNK